MTEEWSLVKDLVGCKVKIVYCNPLDNDQEITGTITGYDKYFVSIDTTGSKIGEKPPFAKNTLLSLYFIVKINFL